MSALSQPPRRARHARRGATAALAAAATVATMLTATPASAAPVASFTSSFESGQDQPAASTSFTAPVNVVGKRYTPGSLLPQLTDVTASGQNAPGEVVTVLTDGNKSTKWLVFATTGWAQYSLDAPVAVQTYTLTSANDDPSRDPKNFTLEGSDDGLTWTVLDTRTDQAWKAGTVENRGVTKTYTVPGTPAAYAHYRLNISANNGSGNIIQLADWELLGESDGQVPLMPIVTAVGNGPISSPTAKTGMGFTGSKALQYAGAHLAAGEATATNVLFDVDVDVAADTQLSYTVFPVLDSDLSYPATYVAVDLLLDDGSLLSAHGPRDAYGYGATARAQGESDVLVPNQWNSVTVDVGGLPGLADRTVDQVLLSYSNPDGSGSTAFSGWVDDVRIDAAPVRDTAAGLVSHVDTRRGTNSSTSYSRGNNVPATAVPNGFNFFVPMTNGGSEGTLYEYSRQNSSQNLPELEGIGISHEPSPWMGDRNQLAVLPSLSATPTSTLTDRELAFTHANETARPDLYEVAFENGITTAVTPTDHAGVYRFEFPTAATVGSVLVDEVAGDSGLAVDAEGVLTGWVDNGSGLSAGRSRMFVYGAFDSRPTTTGAATGDRAASARFAAFDVSSDKDVELRIATSFISLDQAKANLDLEATGRTFDDVQQAARDAWNDRLGVIEVEGATDVERTTLYSNLYRLNLYPNSQFENTGTAADPDYRYASPVAPKTGAATATTTNAKVVAGKVYVNNGFWDTYRTVWPLYSLLYPDVAQELVDGFVQQYRDGGWVARWSSPGYADLMTGTSSDASFAEAYLAGALSTDVALDAYDAALKNATVLPTSEAVGRKGLDTSIFLGYTQESTHQSASWGLEGFINDFGIGEMAAALAVDPATPADRVAQLEEEARYFQARSKNYVNMFNSEAQIFTSRNADGTFNGDASFDKTAWGGAYTEASGWTFGFHAPYDVDGLAALYGGRSGLLADLDEFFATPETASHSGIHEAYEARDVRLGMLGMSNQVAHHIPYVYAAAGGASKTQELVREITQRLFAGSDIGQGYLGDEDNGEMSSWYVFSALGLYPLEVGSGDYTIGSPVFDEATVHLPGGDLLVTAPGASSGKVYVDGVSIDGTPVTDTLVDGDLLRDGGTLAFSMSDTPSTWGDKDLGEQLDVPQTLVDATKAGYGTLTATDGTAVGALSDDNSRSTVHVADGTTELVWTSASGPVVVDQYTLTNAGGTGTAPAAWTLEGSLDGQAWAPVDTRTSEAFRWSTQTRPFAISAQPKAYTSYRLSLSAAQGAALDLAEVELFATAAAASDLSLTAATGPLDTKVDVELDTTLATVVGGGAAATDYAVTVDFRDGDGPQPATLAPNGLGGWAVTAPHVFTRPGTYDALVTASEVGQPAVRTATITIRVTRDATLVGAFDNTCIGDLGTTPASCDGQGYGYDRAKLAATGFVQGATATIPGTDLTYTLPDVAPGDPDNATGAGQVIRLDLGTGAEQIAFIGTGTESGKDLTGTLTYADGSTGTVPLQFGDWVGASGNPSYGNVVVGLSAGRLSGVGAEGSIKNTAVYATAPFDLPKDGDGVTKQAVSLTLPVEAGALRDGRMHLFAIASDGTRTGSSPLAVTASAVGTQVVGTAFDAELAVATGGIGLDSATAVVSWGDGTVVDEVTLTSGAVRGHHTYTAVGTYTVTVTVTVDDGATSATTQLQIVVQTPPAVYTPTIAVSGDAVAPGADVTVTGQGFAAGETVVFTLASTPQVQVSAVASAQGEVSAQVTVPAGSASGTYPLSALGAVSATPASTTVRVQAPVTGPAATTLTLTASSGSVVVGQMVTLTARLSPAAATGEVRFLDGGRVVATAPATGGSGSFTASFPGGPAGEHSYTAEFSPSDLTAHQPSTSAPVVVVVRAAQGSDPVVRVSSAKVTAGGALHLTGSGFLPGETVTAVLHSEPVTLGSARVDASGAFVLDVTIPADTPAGEHTVVVTGDRSGISMGVSVTVGAAADGPATAGGGSGAGLAARLPWTGSADIATVLVTMLALLAAGGVMIGVRIRRRPIGQVGGSDGSVTLDDLGPQA